MDARTKQACRNRRRILAVAENAKAGGWIRGRFLAEVLGIEDADETLGLTADLVNLGLMERRDTRTLKAQEPGLAFAEYKITAKGTRLLSGLEPVEPLVEDERL